MNRILISALAMALHLAAMAGEGVFAGLAARRLLTARRGAFRQGAPFVLFALAAQLPSWIGDENTLLLFPFFILVFSCAFQAPFLARLVTGGVFYLLIVPFNMVVDTVDRWGSWEIGSAVSALLKAGFALLLWLLVRRLTREDKPLALSRRLWVLCGILALAPLIATLSFAIWNGFDHGIDAAQLRLGYTILPFVTVSAVALCAAMTELSRHEALEQSVRMADMRALYYEGIRKQESQLRTLRHDLQNHLAVLRGLLEEGGVDRAAAYLQELSDSPALHGVHRVCENEAANVVLSCKLEQMKSTGVEADFLVSLPKDISVGDTELCALLGNALDNAMEAARGATAPRVWLRMRADRGMLMLSVRNTCAAPPEKRGGAYPTTKADTAAHGFGLPAMEAIAAQYGGTLDAGVKDGCFELVVCLPLKAEK